MADTGQIVRDALGWGIPAIEVVGGGVAAAYGAPGGLNLVANGAGGLMTQANRQFATAAPAQGSPAPVQYTPQLALPASVGHGQFVQERQQQPAPRAAAAPPRVPSSWRTYIQRLTPAQRQALVNELCACGAKAPPKGGQGARPGSSGAKSTAAKAREAMGFPPLPSGGKASSKAVPVSRGGGSGGGAASKSAGKKPASAPPRDEDKAAVENPDDRADVEKPAEEADQDIGALENADDRSDIPAPEEPTDTDIAVIEADDAFGEPPSAEGGGWPSSAGDFDDDAGSLADSTDFSVSGD